MIKDPEGKNYDAFINEPIPAPNWRAVTDLDVNPVMAKIDNYRIQNNIGTTNGRVRPVVNSGWMKSVADATASIRAGKFKELFDNDLSANIGASIKGKKVAPRQLNQAITKLYDQVFDPDINLRQMEDIVNDMKNNVYSQQAFLGAEEYKVVNQAFQDAFTDLYDPKVMRASAMVTNQAAGTIADTSAAINMINDFIVDNTNIFIITIITKA